MKARDFFVKMPELCKCSDAERWADIIGYVYDRELEGKSVWDRNKKDRDRPLSRMDCAMAFDGDPGAKAQCARLAGLIMLTHYKTEHGENHQGMIDGLYTAAVSAEKYYPEIAAVMTAGMAIAGRWAD